MTRDDDDENEGDDDARRSSSARAYAKRRPPALALASGDKTPPGSPSGPFSLHSRRDSLSDASDSFSEVMKETVREEAPRTRSLVVRLKEGDDETLEVRVDAPRLDVVSRRRLGGEKFVFARARTDAERRRCRIARTYQMHVLRLSGTEEEVAGYASRAVAASVSAVASRRVDRPSVERRRVRRVASPRSRVSCPPSGVRSGPPPRPDAPRRRTRVHRAHRRAPPRTAHTAPARHLRGAPIDRTLWLDE